MTALRRTGPARRTRRFPPSRRVPWHGWRRAVPRAYREILTDRIGLAAAGCAFWATLALFPAVGMLVSLYGFAFDLASVEPQLAVLRPLLPPEAFALIAGRVHVLVSHGRSELGESLAISSAIALWSASTGTKSMLSALNLAYDAQERRSVLAFQLIGVVLTLGGIVAAVVGLAILVGLPTLADFLGLGGFASGYGWAAALGLLMGFVLLALSLLYRFGPSGGAVRWQWITPGSVCATLSWLGASVLVSYYVGHLASYDATYGPLGAVAGVMMWFFVSAYVVLAGAEFNAALLALAEEGDWL